MVRAFVAVNLAPEVKAALAAVEERLKSAHAEVGWVKPANLHLTLKFLGAVEEASVGTVGDAVAGAVCGYGSFRLTLQGLGAFPLLRAPRIVWVGVSGGAEALVALQAKVEAALKPLGFPRERRPFTAHLTLGRVRRPGNLAQLAALLTSMVREPLGEMVVERVELMRSELHPLGARYTSLRTCPLG